MSLADAGRRIFKNGIAAATLSFTPLNGRAAIVRRIYIDKVSAGDIWTVSCLGREVGRYDIQTTGNQQPLSAASSVASKTNDIFDVVKDLYDTDLIYPVPDGATFTVASVGGATANVMIAYEECTPAECPKTLLNHPEGNNFISPVSFYHAASVTAAGLQTIDTEVAPFWWPTLFSGNQMPSGYAAIVFGLFLEGGGRNTFSGSADHQSNTTYLGLKLRGQTMFTRDAVGGIPIIGQASATGSANTVVASDLSAIPAFQIATPYNTQSAIMPVSYGPGDTPLWQLNVAGDVTGGATYAAVRQLALVNLRTH